MSCLDLGLKRSSVQTMELSFSAAEGLSRVGHYRVFVTKSYENKKTSYIAPWLQ